MPSVQRNISAVKFPTVALGPKRWWPAVVGVGLVALFTWNFVSSHRGQAGTTNTRFAAKAPAPAIRSTVALRSPPLAVPASVKAAPTGRLAVLRSASREEVLSYARDVLAGGGPLEDIVALLEFLVGDRPELAVDLAREIGRSNGERQVLLYATLSAWASRDASAALRWATRNSAAYDVPGNASLLYIVLEQIATDDPSAAVAVTENALQAEAIGSDEKAGQDVARFTLEALIKHGHAGLARQAIERWARGPERAQLNPSDFQIVAMSLASSSYPNAGAWLESLPSSSSRNEAYRSFATAWLQENASEAMNWAQQLNPADGGDDVRVATFARWLKSDRPAATQWLRAHNSPDPTRLLSLLDADE
jgi:hypothetical protein